jgi:hypothetical protein
MNIDKYIVDLSTREIIMNKDKLQMLIIVKANKLKYIRKLYKLLFIKAFIILFINIFLLTTYLPIISFILLIISYYLTVYYERNKNEGLIKN